MKLAELEPGWVSRSTTDATRIGVHFLCPACRKQQLYIPTNDPDHRVNWGMSGELDQLTLTPSVDAKHVNGGAGTDEPRVECRWHGWIRNGEAVTC